MRNPSAGRLALRRRSLLLAASLAALRPAVARADGEDVTAGIATDPQLDARRPHLRVHWIGWDSAFRAAGLRVGDRITALDGVPVHAPQDTRERQRYVQSLPGQSGERGAWAAAGCGAGDKVRLDVMRRQTPTGWQCLSITAALVPDRSDRTADGEPALGPGGPDTLASDGFDDSWMSWYEQRLLPMLVRALDGGWQSRTWGSRFELGQLQQQAARVAALVAKYPGPFSDALAADFATAVASAQGRLVTLAPDALRWRQAEDDKRDAAQAAARAAWAAWQQAHAAEIIPAFPAVDPLKGDRARVAGRLVVLDPLRPQDWVQGADRSYFVAGSAEDHYYAADAEQPASLAMLLALERWRRLVSTQIDESYVIAARIAANPTLVVIEGESRITLQLEPVAAMVGDAMFVDLAGRRGIIAKFAGEADLELPRQPAPLPDASPADVLAASVEALKHGDLAAWKALFADFGYQQQGDGAIAVNPWQEPPSEDRWEDSRRLLLTKLFDAQVAWVDDPVVIADGTQFAGQTRIDEVAAELDHVGRFDGPDGPEYRVFNDGSVHRQWTLLRMDGGPWRIASAQGI